jgi:hypothetical protein
MRFSFQNALTSVLVFMTIVSIAILVVLCGLFMATIMNPALAGILLILLVVFLIGGLIP